jgi:hypothetical protein
VTTSIAFTDELGAATLTNGKPVPADRFRNWTPDVDPIGPTVPALGTGILFHWNHRTDYLATLELHHIRPAQHAVALRLKEYLQTGGTCTIATGDSAGNTYTCRLAPGTTPTLRQTDPVNVEYVLSLAVKHTASAPLVCLY